QEPQLARNLKLVRLLRAIGRLHGRTPAEVAIAWVLHNPAVTGAIVGARRPGQVRGVVGAAELRLSGRELAEIEAFFAKAAACPLRVGLRTPVYLSLTFSTVFGDDHDSVHAHESRSECGAADRTARPRNAGLWIGGAHADRPC